MDERTQAIIETLQAQRNLMADREAMAQGEIASLKTQLQFASSSLEKSEASVLDLNITIKQLQDEITRLNAGSLYVPASEHQDEQP